MNNRANDLDGKQWLKYSFSIWRDVAKTKDEKNLNHPAMFPIALTSRLMEIFSKKSETILDPFLGSGTTILSAYILGRKGIGIELSKKYINLTKKRLKELSRSISKDVHNPKILNINSLHTKKFIKKNSVDLVITSPPYWNILNENRSADYKKIKKYSEKEEDLGNIGDYKFFLEKLKSVFSNIHEFLKKDKYCIVIVMDIRKKSQFYPLHMDLVRKMEEIGFTLDDIIIWDRQAEYNNMRPLGYPYVFRINKVHEFILIFKK